MLRPVIAIALLTGVLHTVVAANEFRCGEPFAPVIIDPNTATREQMSELRKDVVAFIAGSDFFQECLIREMNTLPPDKARERQRIIDMIDANQAEKERVGAEYNAASTIFNQRSDLPPAN